jgi:hypothetical protein
MRRSPGSVALVAALVLALSGAGLAIAKKKHHGKPPRGPYPSLGGCPVFPQSSAAPNAPSAADESAWHQDVSAAPLDPNSASYIAYIDAQDGPAHAVAVALKQYGALIADNRANWFISGTSDRRWPDENLDQLKSIPGSGFVVVESAAAIHAC